MSVAVVLGAAVWPGGQPSPTLRRRSLHAAELFRLGSVSHVICCGGLGKHPPSEAEIMQKICREAGVPDSAILLEDQSRTTLENLANIRALLARLDQPSIVIVTDGYHKWRALMVARHFGFQAQASCPLQSGTSGLKVVKFWLREVPALIYYWWRLRRLGQKSSG